MINPFRTIRDLRTALGSLSCALAETHRSRMYWFNRCRHAEVELRALRKQPRGDDGRFVGATVPDPMEKARAMRAWLKMGEVG